MGVETGNEAWFRIFYTDWGRKGKRVNKENLKLIWGAKDKKRRKNVGSIGGFFALKDSPPSCSVTDTNSALSATDVKPD